MIKWNHYVLPSGWRVLYWMTCSMGLAVFSGVCLFSEPYLNRGALFFGCFCTTLSLDCSLQIHTHTHTPAVPFNPIPPHTHTQSQGRPELRSKRPTVAMGTISTLSALLRSAWSEAICPLPILHSSYPSTSSLPLFLLSKTGKRKRKSHPPFKRHDCSFS